MGLRSYVRDSLLLLVAFACAPVLLAQTIADPLADLEKQADEQVNKRDYPAAEKTYFEAITLAKAAGNAAKTAFYYRRLGICYARTGELPSALDAYRHGIEAAELSGDIDLQAENVHGAALALQKLGHIDEALPLAQREYDLTEKCGHPEHLVRAMWLVSELESATGKTRAGLQLLTKALAISRTTSDHAGTAILLDNLALGYGSLGDFDAAAQIEREIISNAERETPNTVAIAYNNLGEILFQAGQHDEAGKWFEKAAANSTGSDQWRVHVGALFNVADIDNRAGRYAASDAAFTEALGITRSVKIPDLESAGLRMRSSALLSRGDNAGAAETATEALSLARNIASPDRTADALLSLGSARVAMGQQVAARASFDEALAIAETLRAQASGEASDLRGAFEQLVPLYQASVQNLVNLHFPAEALQRAEQAKARVLMDILLRGGVDERAVMTPAETAKQDQLRKRLASANGVAANTPSDAATEALHDAMREFRDFRRDIYYAHSDLAIQSADFEPAGINDLNPLLPGPNTALLDFFVVPSGVVLFVVRDREGHPEVSAFLLPDTKHTLAADARSFREQLAGREPGYKAAAQNLYNRLLAPAMAKLRGTTEWIVSPDAALWDVPFAALVDPAGKHVIETRAITLVPSLTAALEIHRRSEVAAKQPHRSGAVRLLAFGNPLPSPQPLPDAVREVAQISANYPRGSAITLTGGSATATAFRDKAPSADIIHLATHAGLNNGDPLSSFIKLGSGAKESGEDGVMTALDIMSLHLRADLVVLSACETALGSTGPGEGMMGMGWALSAAGASSSVLSSWKVDSTASRSFMVAFHRNLTSGNGVSKSAALRDAGLEMLHSEAYRHPFYWAAFTLWGDSGSRSAPTGTR